MTVIYFVDNKMGGVSSLNFNLMANQPDKSCEQWVIHIDVEDPQWTKADLNYPVNKQLYFNYSAQENTYSVLKRLKKLLPPTEAALVLNYEIEMAMLDHYKVSQTVYQLIHDDYNVNLAKKYGHLVDVFICHNSIIYKKLLDIFPLRKNNIFYLPHGVKIPAIFRDGSKENDPIRLLFLGRMAASKGVFDLPEINNMLRAMDIPFEWTCIGGGPELEKLKAAWNPSDKVKFVTASSNDEVLSICANHDVFVLPTKFEGSPVSLLETMSTGLVPVITDLEGGIRDIVNDEIGFRIPINDNNGFAEAIKKLHEDRVLLDRLSRNCRSKIIAYFDVQKTASAYHELFQRYKEFYKAKKIRKIKVGARLDHPFIAASLTKFVRIVRKKFKS